MERVMGIEPTRPAWKAGVLPLNYTRMYAVLTALSIIPQALWIVKMIFAFFAEIRKFSPLRFFSVPFGHAAFPVVSAPFLDRRR